jgi:conjugative transfer pilus assembly protein TraH
MKFKRIVAAVMVVVISNTASAMTMQQLFDSVGAQANVTNPAVLQGQTMNLYTGGSLFMRMPQKTYNLVTVTPPSWSAGCGGINLFTGGFSYVNKAEFVAMLRNIGSNALGYSFKLAIQNLCPTCDNVMQALQATAQAINRSSIDSCQAAEGIVNAAAPAAWTQGQQNAAKNWGVNMNMYSDAADAWSQVMNNQGNANNVLKQAASSSQSADDSLPTGNVVWKALKKLNGIDDNYRMVIMSMVGTVIFPTDGSAMKVQPALDITLDQLVGKQDGSANLDFPVYRCDTSTADGCLNPTVGNIGDNGPVSSFRNMVSTKLYEIADKIASRQPHSNLGDVLGFINVTDLPVYKMVAIGTSLNNTGLADAMINRYEDLIAAKYAEVYIRSAVADLNQSLGRYQQVATDPAVGKAVTDTQDRAEKLKAQARQQLANAYTQTMSTFSMVQEVQFMERAMDANMSSTLRASLNFGRSLK